MTPAEAAHLALKTFSDIQGKQTVSGVLVEAIIAPVGKDGEWRVTIGYSPSRELLGVPVLGHRLRSDIRFTDDGKFLGMHVERNSS